MIFVVQGWMCGAAFGVKRAKRCEYAQFIRSPGCRTDETDKEHAKDPGMTYECSNSVKHILTSILTTAGKLWTTSHSYRHMHII
jgi:hypothetical protein